MSVLEQLGTHVAHDYRETLSDGVRESARLHLVDTVGAWIAASGTPEGRALMRFLAGREQTGADPVGENTLTRVACNCGLARLSEIDDIHLSSCTTPGALIVPSALTIGGSLGLSGAAIGEAIAVGYEAMVRLGAALGGPSILYRGIWPTYFAAPFGVAATASRLLGLTGRQAAHALGIALVFASPAVGRQSGAAMSRWLATGYAARSGVSAALSAQAGFTADLAIFEGDFFSNVYNLLPDVAALVDALGDRSVLPKVSFKPWCAARQTMAATQALKEIIEAGVPPSDITQLIVSVPPSYLRMIDHGVVPGDRASHLTSVSYQMALAALAPDALFDVKQAPERVSGEIGAFMAKVTVKADDDLLRHYPKSWPARLRVTTPREKHEKLVIHVPGDPERLFDETQVAAKFRRVVTPSIGEHAADDLLRLSLAVLDGEQDVPQALLAQIERVTGAALASKNPI
ncbi:MAG TPA: MmgE/PrpD family protein [Burkholderiales bacterium]|nr:MmgE/PrpD family protein [Burkholderiales bacterium]